MDYEEQLDRAIDQTPDIDSEADRFTVPDVDVRTEGHATVFENFQSILDRLDREENHLLRFLQDELGTSASIDESGRARLTGDFGTRRVQEAVDGYVEAFVRCSECGLPDTRIVKEQGTDVLKCDACGALSSIDV